MGPDHQEVLEEIEEWLEKLYIEFPDWVIMVEGRKDIDALQKLGVKQEIIHLNQGISNLDLLETLWRDRKGKVRGIVILTDWDRTGGKLARSMGRNCLSLDIPYDLEMRRGIALVVGKWIRDIESMDTFYETLKEDNPHFFT